jgi:hypothetical protein
VYRAVSVCNFFKIGWKTGHVELWQGMEFILNLVWVLLAVAIVRLWTSYARQEGVSRRAQVIALATLIVILLPVISITDDLQTIQNPAELECCARRNHVVSCPHSIFPAVATLPPPTFAMASYGFLRFVAPSNFPVPTVDNPALAPIQNRPPPAA